MDSLVKLCECGCGKRVSKEGNKFIKGHWVRTLEFGTNKGKHWSKEVKEKQRQGHIKRYKEKPDIKEEHSRYMIEWWKNHPDEKEKQKVLFKSGWSDYMNSFNNTEEIREYKSKEKKEQWADPDSVYHTKEYWEKRKVGENKKPNKCEIKILNILMICSNKWNYTGDYSFWIERKNPDFINFEEKKIIELFGWVHTEEFRKKYNNDFKSNKDHEKERKKIFSKTGYKTLVIWESELKNIKKVEEKIKRFIEI